MYPWGRTVSPESVQPSPSASKRPELLVEARDFFRRRRAGACSPADVLGADARRVVFDCGVKLLVRHALGILLGQPGCRLRPLQETTEEVRVECTLDHGGVTFALRGEFGADPLDHARIKSHRHLVTPTSHSRDGTALGPVQGGR